MMEEQVILVDENDNALGTMGKTEAHVSGVLHRAFSVFLFNEKNEMLIHQRAFSKYHSPGLWTNACCSHPRPSESAYDAAQRRLQEELGIQCPIEKSFDFLYRAELENALIEHEYDHVFTGEFSGKLIPNPDEVQDWKYMAVDHLVADVEQRPEHYTAWFKMILPKIVEQRNIQLRA